MASLINSIEIEFKNKPTENGLVNIKIKNCVVAPSGSPNSPRPQIMIHLPKESTENVDGAWVDYDGWTWHVIGTNARLMDSNVPNKWDRYAIAERIKYL